MTHAISAFPTQTGTACLMSPPTQATNIAKVTFLTFRINGSQLAPVLARNTLDLSTFVGNSVPKIDAFGTTTHGDEGIVFQPGQ